MSMQKPTRGCGYADHEQMRVCGTPTISGVPWLCPLCEKDKTERLGPARASITPIFGGPKPGEPIPGVVAQLETMLALAKTGELQSFGAGYVRSDGKITTVLEAHGELFALSHALATIWYRFQKRMDEDTLSP